MKKKTLLTFPPRSVADFRRQPKRPMVLVLDNIRSTHNVGAAFRIADAFALFHLYLCGLTPTPPHPGIQKTALGAENSTAWSHHPNIVDLLQKLKRQEYHLIGVELTEEAIPLQQFPATPIQPPYALLFGHEVFGINDQALALTDGCVEIPQDGTKFSLNVSVCMGIVSWHMLQHPHVSMG